MPSNSQITRDGIGQANTLVRSTGPPVRSASSRSASSRCSTISSIRGVSRLNRRIVNSGVRIFRIRVWSGGSANPSPPGSLSAETPASPTRLEKSLLNDFTSLSTAFASSCPLTSHARMPKGNGSLLTGSRSRVSPSCGTGSSPSRFSGNSVFSESGIFERSKPCFCLRARYFRPIHPAIRERRVVMPRCYRPLRHAKQHALLHGLPPGFDGLGRRHVDTLPRPGHRDRHSDGLGLRPHTVDGVTPTVQRELERAPVHKIGRAH